MSVDLYVVKAVQLTSEGKEIKAVEMFFKVL